MDTDKDTIVSKGKDVTVVVSRNVFPGHEKEYDDWVRRLVAAAKESPGNQGVTILIPERGKTGLHHVVMKFANEKSMLQWETSYTRQKLSHEADEFSERVRQEATGMETWFSIPAHPELTTPPHWKMAIVTFIAVYIVGSIFVPIVGNIMDGANFYVENIVVSAVLVALLTWLVMPVFSRYIFRRWLYRSK
jgi:antibiotic biosynthesis monooxygenase (ABM) superfamily enzyme